MTCLTQKFADCGIGGQMLADLTKEYCMRKLAMEKKLIMSLWQLARQSVYHPLGTAFD